MTQKQETEQTAGIAIVGMAGRFPMARDCAEFWSNLEAGRECLTRFTDEDLRASGIELGRPGSDSARARGVLSDADLFDASFFGLSPKDADMMDPQQRVFLEVAWEAIEDAGYDHDRVPGAVGVFAGSGINTYFMSNVSTRKDLLDSHGMFPTVVLNEKDFLATRLAYRLNLKGPAMTVQTACSTSLVAVCNACQSLLSFECDLALAGGAHIAFPQCHSMVHAQGGMLSQDGHCRPFDKGASGTIFSDGVGAVLLKRLDDALVDGDNIVAVIKGHALNNDGSDKAGYTAPSVNGQADVIQMAHAFGGIDPGTITYIEAHGTATPLGDPIEIAALTKAFRARTQATQYCAIGSVKSNIGHLDVAAGIAGLIKTALAIQHGKIPPSINFDEANPEIDFASSPFYVADKLIEWRPTDSPRRAAVSSFGIGGTNAHVVLEEPPQRSPSGPTRPYNLLCLSARTESALDEASQNLAGFLQADPSVILGDVAYTLQQGRHEFQRRHVLVCRDVQQAIDSLHSDNGHHRTTSSSQNRCSEVAFMFPGQGSQYVNMGRELYEHEEVFRCEIDRCAEMLQPDLDLDLRDLLYPEAARTEWAEDLLVQTRITQPALFATEYALAQLWMSWGIQPSAMIGHSVGEYVAACLARVFSLPDAIKVIATRGRLMQDQPPGAMLAVMRAESEIREFIQGPVSLAAINAPALCVVSGESSKIDELQGTLKDNDVASRRLHTSHAFHSKMMEPVIAPFAAVLDQIDLHTPVLPFVSNVTGNWITKEEATDSGYWTKHLRQGVLFAQGLGTVLAEEGVALLEVGPGRTLTMLAKQHPSIRPGHPIAYSLPSAKEGTPEQAATLLALGQLWQASVSVNWDAFYQGETRHRIPLPTYSFDRKRHWADPKVPATHERCSHAVQPRERQESGSRDELMQLPVDESLQRAGNAAATTTKAIEEILVDILQDLSGIEPDQLRDPATFPEMEFDSLFLFQVSLSIEQELGVSVTFRDLGEEVSSLKALVSHIESSIAQAPNSSLITKKISKPAERGQSRPVEEGQSRPGKNGQTRDAESASPDQIREQLDYLTMQVDRLVQLVGNGQNSQDYAKNGSIVETRQPSHLPLTSGQREIWLASQINDDASRTYNEACLVRLKGNLDKAVLQDCIQELIERHDALRTTFLEDGSQQRVASTLDHQLVSVDISNKIGSDSQELELHHHVSERTTQLMDLSTGPLAQFVLFKLEEGDHTLLVVFHHIVVDGWSWGTLLRELGEIYRARCEGRSPDIRPSVQYADYVNWSQAPSQQEKANSDKKYWLDLYADKPREIRLPTDHPRPRQKTYKAGHLREIFDESFTAELRQACRNLNCTLFNLLLTGFKIWLHRVTGQEDIIVGVPMAGQISKEIQRMGSVDQLVGNCVNMLPIQSQFRANSSIADVLSGVRTSLLDARDHQSFTFGELLQILDVTRDASRVPLISVSFNLGRAHTTDFGDVHATVERPLKEFNYFDLTIDSIDFGESLAFDCKFNRDLFESSSAKTWLLQFRHILEQAIAHPNALVSDVSLLSPDERDRLLVEWNATQMAYDREATLHGLFERQAERTPEAVAAVYDGTSVTYGQLEERSNRLAAYLRSQVGAGPGELIGVCLDRSLDMLVALLATLKSGAAYVPLDPAYPADRIAYVLKDARAAAVITQEGLLDMQAELPSTIVCIDRDWRTIEACSSQRPQPLAASEDLAYVIYTSGSTGRPKGVQIEHRAAVNFLESMARQPGLGADDVLLAVTTLSFDIAVLELYLPLKTGGTVVIASRQTAMDARALESAIQEYGVSVMQATPATWRMMLESGWSGRSTLKILCGGEAMPSKLAKELLPKCAELWNMYGPTETTVWSTCCRIEDPDNIHIGRPIGNTQVYILDKDFRPTPVGVPGELMIGGDGLARGYLDRPELTDEKFIASPVAQGSRIYRTGDLAKYRPDGTIECLGRADFQVKIRGFRIELGEIESVLAEQQGVRLAVAVDRENGSGDKRLVAYYVADDPRSPPRAEQLREALRASLPEYMVPSAFTALERMPLTSNGKIDRKALPEPADTAPAVRKPRTPAEETLVVIWKKVLRIPEVGIHDSFFDLGGHSLLAVSLFNEIEQSFGVRLSLATLFRAQTIAELAKSLDSPPQENADGWPSLVPICEGGTKPRFYCVHASAGNVLLYQKLSQYLGDDYPFYGLQSQGLDGKTAPFKTVEQMAEHYVEEIRAAQPNGPYYLGGFCLGGTIAYHMAQVLKADGEDVALLALLDTYNFREMLPPSSFGALRQRMVFHLKNLVRVPLAKWPSYLASKWRIARDGEFKTMIRESFPRVFTSAKTRGGAVDTNVHDINHNAAQLYDPPNYHGTLTVIKPMANYDFFPDKQMGWAKLAANLEIVELRMNPHAMLVEPFVKELARVLSQRIDQPSVGGSPRGPRGADETIRTSEAKNLACQTTN